MDNKSRGISLNMLKTEDDVLFCHPKQLLNFEQGGIKFACIAEELLQSSQMQAFALPDLCEIEKCHDGRIVIGMFSHVKLLDIVEEFDLAEFQVLIKMIGREEICTRENGTTSVLLASKYSQLLWEFEEWRKNRQ